MQYRRMPIEVESPEEIGYDTIRYNLAESSMTDFLFNAQTINLSEVLLCYGDHRGKPELRDLIVRDEPALSGTDVLLTVGAASALFIVATSLLKTGDRIFVVRPNYATNIETPRAIGCQIDFYDLLPENGYQHDIDAIIDAIKPETRLVSLTSPNNPTGATLSTEDLRRLIAAAEAKGTILLIDETYRDLRFSEPAPLAASLSPSVISVSSLSKSMGLPGLRLGWLICRNAALMELFLAAKEQIFITNSILDETAAYQLLLKKHELWPKLQAQLIENRDIVAEFMAGEPRLGWTAPNGGCVCFPAIKTEYQINIDRFYEILFQKYGTFVGAGHWFEADRRFFRLGFGWIDAPTLRQGLANISLALTEAGEN